MRSRGLWIWRATAAVIGMFATVTLCLYLARAVGDDINPARLKDTDPARLNEVPAVKIRYGNTTTLKEAPAENAKEKIGNVNGTRNGSSEVERKPSQPGCFDLENLDRDKALIIGHRKKEKGFLTIGITTAKRPNVSYLHPTLKSLIDNANELERSQLRIVVFSCDFVEGDRQEAHDIIVSGFAEHVRSGLLQLIEAPRSFYPPLTNLKRTFNDPAERVLWRSKECIDTVFLAAYSVGLSEYYMLFDDDLYTFPRYIQTISNFVNKYKNEKWILLDISERGTAKLFRDSDLLGVGRYVAQFYQEKPVDMLLGSLKPIRSQKTHYLVKPPLFIHLGVVSTLGLKNKKN